MFRILSLKLLQITISIADAFGATRFFFFRTTLHRLFWPNIDKTVKICGGFRIFGNGYLHIGKNTWLGIDATFFLNSGSKIVIGDNCDFGPAVTLLTGTHEIGTDLRRAGSEKVYDIKIESGCWLGAGSLILPGVHLGAGTIVAAGSVVTRSFGNDSLIAGNPAELKKRLE